MSKEWDQDSGPQVYEWLQRQISQEWQQRWSKMGAQNVHNLRTLHLSGLWSHFQRYLGATA